MNSVFALTSPDELQTRADHGEAESQYRFAKKIFYQDGTSLDRAVAAKYFKMAADQNHPKGQNGYGACLEFGIGVEIDIKEAAKYYMLSASQGDPIGQMNYGICLLNGYGIPKYVPPVVDDKKKSYNYNDDDDENGLAPGDIINGRHGLDISVDSNSANSKPAYPVPPPPDTANTNGNNNGGNESMMAEQPISSSSSSRTHQHLSSINSSLMKEDALKNKAKTTKIPPPAAYFKYSADTGEVGAQSIYGRCLLRGVNVEKDFKEAEKYLQLAADAGDGDAKRCFQYYSTISEHAYARKKLPLNKPGKSGNNVLRARSVLQSVTKR